jgi:hypothetical protein
MHRVEVVNGQVSNRMILGKLGEVPNSLVDIFFLYQIFRDARRIFQARVIPKLGEAVLQGLDSTLHKERHKLDTRQSSSLVSFQSLNAR